MTGIKNEARMTDREIIDRIIEYGKGQGELPEPAELAGFIDSLSGESEDFEYLRSRAYDTAHDVFGSGIYIRGLIEISNICKNDCLYCGIRKSNQNIDRYRLSKADITGCVRAGYDLGFRTFVLQGGEDMGRRPEEIADIVSEIKKLHPDSAVTLSLGEQTEKVYRMWRAAGADRYLLRHETADKAHYEMLHPKDMSYDNRVACLYTLKELGYQVGSGFMVGSPYQTSSHLAEDLIFLAKLQPHMIGIGPFVPHHDTIFAKERQGGLRQTLVLISILRLMFPAANIPATTALGTIAPDGRELAFMHGANVVMPNLSPLSVRKKYELYDNKICTGEESATCIDCLKRRASSYGFSLLVDRGDYKLQKIN